MRQNHAYLQQQFGNLPVTPIEKIEFNFSMSKKQTNNQMLSATQFPLKLSFACTAHKMQGATVPKPNSLIVDLRHVMEPAQAYVILSRVEEVNQLFIIEEIPKAKIIPSPLAIEEHARLVSSSLNNAESLIREFTLFTSLNIRSLPKHIADLKSDYKMLKTKMISLQETWCSDNYDNSHLSIDGFDLHLTNQGNGKGIATYFMSKYFKLVKEVNNEKYQMTLFSTHENTIHIVNIYRSHAANTDSFLQDLESMISNYEICYIFGDFNIDYLNSNHEILAWIINHGFSQLVNSPTHEEGGLLDHAYVKAKVDHKVHLHWPYYSDHAAICIEKCLS